MQSIKLFLALLGLTTVQAIIRPGYGHEGYSGHGGYADKDCDHPTKKSTVSTTRVITTYIPTTPEPTSTTPAPTSTSTSPVIRPSCISGWTLYERSSGPWCMKVITSAVNISVTQATALCTSNGAVLTAFENQAEKDAIVAEAQPYIMSELQLGGGGSIAIAGNRNTQCNALNDTSMAQPICTGKTTAFTLPTSANTNSEYLWTTWAYEEPNNGRWTYDAEDCLQLHIKPSDVQQQGLINDFYCERSYAPNTPDDTLYKNYGALCGRAADLSANGK